MINSMNATSDIGLVGLAVMGQNLALNIADHGYNIAVFNRNPERTIDFIAECKANEPAAPRVTGYTDVAAFVHSIKRPRKIILLVKAGKATDDTIATLLPHLEADDIVIDGGNALWGDTIRREKELSAKGFCFHRIWRFRWRNRRTLWPIPHARRHGKSLGIVRADLARYFRQG